jgi:hypothetical protein
VFFICGAIRLRVPRKPAGHTLMVWLIAFLHVAPPILIQEYQSREECDHVLAELAADVAAATSPNVRLICIGPDMELERRRF